MSGKWEIVKEKASADIIDAAVLEFAEKGYRGATTRSIAARAGVSNGLVGKYFQTKDNLLLEIVCEDTLERIFSDVKYEDPYRIFCIFIDYFRKQQKDDPNRFKIHSSLVNDPNTPEILFEKIRSDFSGSLMESAILKAQEEGELVGGDAYQIFTLFFKSLFILLDQYRSIEAEAPDNDAILSVLGYNQDEIRIEKPETEWKELKTIIEYTSLAMNNIEDREKVLTYLKKTQQSEKQLQAKLKDL